MSRFANVVEFDQNLNGTGLRVGVVMARFNLPVCEGLLSACIHELKRLGVADADMLDGHRLLVGDADRLGNIRQLKILLDRGYQGVVSFEPFAAEVMDAKNSEEILKTSMDYIRANV